MDLYARRFEGKRLKTDEFVISADELGRTGARCEPLDSSVSPARTTEPDVRVATHPALHEPVPSSHASDSVR